VAAAPHSVLPAFLKKPLCPKANQAMRCAIVCSPRWGASLARIAPHLEPVVLKLGDVVCEAGGLLKHPIFRKARYSRF
jgi:hypothetical protein